MSATTYNVATYCHNVGGISGLLKGECCLKHSIYPSFEAWAPKSARASEPESAIDTSPASTRSVYRNRILQTLPVGELRRLRPYLTRVRLIGGDVLHQAGDPIEYAFFVEQGFVSLVAHADANESRVEVGLIGRESVVGSSLLLAADTVSYVQSMVQVPGTAYCVPAVTLHASLKQAPTLRQLMRQALEASIVQLAQTAACNSRHTLPERLARWLLMAHDRIDGNELPVTHEILAVMLAVRRPGITIALGTLQTAGLLRHSRGRIEICDRPRLEAAACTCYERVRRFIEIGANLRL